MSIDVEASPKRILIRSREAFEDRPLSERYEALAQVADFFGLDIQAINIRDAAAENYEDGVR